MSLLRRIRLRAKRAPGPIGRRCKGFPVDGCVICDAWLFKDSTGRFPHSYDELRNHRTEAA